MRKPDCLQRNSHIFVYNLWITAMDSRRERQKSRIAANCPNSLRTKLRLFDYLECVGKIDGGREQVQIESLTKGPKHRVRICRAAINGVV